MSVLVCVCNYIYFQIGTSNIFTWFCSHLNFPHTLIPLDRLVCYASSSQLSQQIIKCIAMMRNNIIFKVFRLHRFLYYFLLLNDVSVFWVWKQKKINKFQVNTEFFTSILNPKHIDCNIRKMCKYLFILQSCVVCTYFLPHYFSSRLQLQTNIISADWHQEAHKRNHICEDTYVVVLLQKYRVYYIFGIVLNTHTLVSYIMKTRLDCVGP